MLYGVGGGGPAPSVRIMNLGEVVLGKANVNTDGTVRACMFEEGESWRTSVGTLWPQYMREGAGVGAGAGGSDIRPATMGNRPLQPRCSVHVALCALNLLGCMMSSDA